MAEMIPLRRRMIEDMTIRNLCPATQRSYINAVQKFSRYFGRSPDRLGPADIHTFQVHLVSIGTHFLHHLFGIAPKLQIASELARRLAAILRGDDEAALDQWITDAIGTECIHLS